MSSKQAKEVLERWTRTLRRMREAPSSSNTYSQRGDHFSFPVPGEANRQPRKGGHSVPLDSALRKPVKDR